MRTTRVPKGTAVDDCLDHATRLIVKKIAKHTPGKSCSAV
jgi:hypothetical protein